MLLVPNSACIKYVGKTRKSRTCYGCKGGIEKHTSYYSLVLVWKDSRRFYSLCTQCATRQDGYLGEVGNGAILKRLHRNKKVNNAQGELYYLNNDSEVDF